jgi:hypothetical protein
MNPATDAAITPAFVWFDMSDAMFMNAYADSNCKSGTEIYKHC